MNFASSFEFKKTLNRKLIIDKCWPAGHYYFCRTFPISHFRTETSCLLLPPLLPLAHYFLHLVDFQWFQLYTDCSGEIMVKPAERKPLRLLTVQLLVLMLDMKRDQLTINHLHQAYHGRYKQYVAFFFKLYLHEFQPSYFFKIKKLFMPTIS